MVNSMDDFLVKSESCELLDSLPRQFLSATMPSSSPSSSASSSSNSLDDEDESVRIAVSALGDMKKGTRTSSSSSNGTPPSSSPSSPAPDSTLPDFVSRVTNLPLVGTALRAYEHGKASSRVVKYGAEMMESSVKNISRPVIDRLPVDVNQLDEFACRQLDRLERYRRLSASDDKMQVDAPVPQFPNTGKPACASKIPCDDDESALDVTHDCNGLSYLASALSDARSSATESRTPTPPSQDPSGHPDQNVNRQVVPRSRWHSVLLEAGGIGAAVSEESMRRLKYCLQWLQYATAHIDSQMLILRDFTDSLQSYVVDPSASDTYISPTHMRTLHDVRRDVVNTIRQVVDVVSKYAGGALPEPARARVRSFILNLPQRWASASTTYCVPEGTPGANSVAGASAGGTGNNWRALSGRHRKERTAGGPDRSLSATPVSSRAPSPLASSRASMGRPTASAATRAAQHILMLATESLDMVRGVTGVVKESLDRADAWVERLRVIGVQRQQRAPDELFNSTTSPGAQYRHSLPGLSSTASTPAQTNTPLSIPSTPAAYPSPDGLRAGIHLSETSARASLSELRLDEDGRDADGYETPKYGLRPLYEEGGEHVWEKLSANVGLETSDRI